MKRIECEQMKEHILNAVIACKIEAAGEEVSLTKVSSRAGISERTLNRYFSDKEMMFYEAAIKYLGKLFDVCAETYNNINKSHMNGLEKICMLLQLQIDKYKNDIMSAKSFVRAFSTALYTAVYRNLPVAVFDANAKEVLLQCINEGIEDGSIRKNVVPMDVYLLISSNFNGLTQRLIYIYSVEFSEENNKKELFAVFEQYLVMLKDYLSSKNREE